MLIIALLVLQVATRIVAAVLVAQSPGQSITTNSQTTMNRVSLFSLDFGTTTSSAMLVQATVARSSTTGQLELINSRVLYRSPAVFTPFIEGQQAVCEESIESYIHQWMKESGVTKQDIFSGGAIVTGLTAKKSNAERISYLINSIVGEAFVSTVNDPCLESWLAFKGNAGRLSRLNEEEEFLNLDIGGGTTNPAVGRSGEVLSTGCYYIGARHFEFTPGTYQLLRLSREAQFILDELGMNYRCGQSLHQSDIVTIVTFMVDQLQAICRGFGRSPRLQQIELHLPTSIRPQRILFSGGVAEILFRYIETGQWPTQTYYGDLGGELARAIAHSDLFDADYLRSILQHLSGRATVYGLALHNTEISGTTVYMSSEDVLPRNNLPLLGEISPESTDRQISELMSLLHRTGGAAISIRVPLKTPKQVRQLALRLQPYITSRNNAKKHLALFLLSENVACTLGNYLSNWGSIKSPLVVIDEIARRKASFVSVGKIAQGVVPISYFGMQHDSSK